MAEVVISSGRCFQVNEGESILDAALRQNIVLEYSCRTGRCGTCRAHVKSGSTTALHDETGLDTSEQAGGWILTCVRTAISDVALDVEDLTGIAVYPIRTLPCRVHALDRVSADIVLITLRLPPDSRFIYSAGQYINVIGQERQRSYSIANAPAGHGLLELQVRQVPGGRMSEYWFHQAKVNDLLRLRGPMGTSVLRGVGGRDLVFLATGTGIAPIKAMLEELVAASPAARPRCVSLYWGGRVPQDIYWDPAEVRIECRFIPVLSRAGQEWDGERGYVQEVFMASESALGQTMVYACGSDAMIRAARTQLIAAGLPEHHFRSDAFVQSGGEI